MNSLRRITSTGFAVLSLFALLILQVTPAFAAFTYVTQWGGNSALGGQMSNPWDVTVSSSGDVYVVDNGDYRIEKFDTSGKFITMWGSYGTGDGQFKYPSEAVIDSDGNVYVTDRTNNNVQKFDSNGNFIMK